MGTDETDLEQEKQVEQKSRIRKLRAEGKTYREIAGIEHVSISTISRTLNDPNQQPNEMVSQEGDIAAKVFQLLERGHTLPQVVIKLRLRPEAVEDLHNKWVKLKQIDFNQPNLEKLDEKLKSHISAQYELDNFLEQAMEMGTNRKENCSHKNSDESCIFSSNTDEEEISSLRCVFCNYFVIKKEDVMIAI